MVIASDALALHNEKVVREAKGRRKNGDQWLEGMIEGEQKFMWQLQPAHDLCNTGV